VEYEKQADDMERDAERMEEKSERVEEDIEDTRREWEAKEEDPSVPGAQPDPGEEQEPRAGAESDEDLLSEEGGP
jgi:hypothetical protein